MKLTIIRAALFVALLLAGAPNLTAQQAITGASASTTTVGTGTTYSASGAAGGAYPGITFTYNYGSNSGTTNNKVFLNNFTAASGTYFFEYGFALSVRLNRVDNALITGNRDLLYNEGTQTNNGGTGTVNINAPYVADMATLFVGNDDLRSGTDNLFGNAGDGSGNNNNIERLDLQINGTNGYVVGDPTKEGFAVFERGTAGAHDPFTASVITGLSGGLPSAYTGLRKITSADYGATNPIANGNSIVLRRDGGAGNLQISAAPGAQGIGGIFFRFSDFGITAGTRVYGYSLAGGDFVSNSAADMVAFTNAANFPTNTASGAAGGIDLSAITGVFRIFNDDTDGLPNTTDIDDDNDGITDLVENGGFDAYGDADGDAILNFVDETPGTGQPAFTDTNNDGINDRYDADKDGQVNQIDLDSDNDGITDLVEAGGIDTNSDGLVDSSTDTDGDGLVNLYDSSTGGFTIQNLDSDSDGIPNARDLDSDNDGIADVAEVGGVDVNGDGRLDNFNDADGDGLDDTIDGDIGNDGTVESPAKALLYTGAEGTVVDGRPENYPLGYANTDGRSLPNPYDLDSDNDGIADVIEVGGLDADNNGRADSFSDTDGDGFADTRDGDVGNDGTAENTANVLLTTGADANDDGRADSYTKANADGAGVANPYDLDSDNDGLTDLLESGGIDSNGDGRIDDLNDPDGNGWQNTYDPTQGGINIRTLDANGATTGGGVFDYDGDGIANYLDLDSDSDGIPDILEQGGTDSDNDGKVDAITDVDMDGYADALDPINNLSGAAIAGAVPLATSSTIGANNLPTVYSAGDNLDRSGLINSLDLDADGDGLLDIREAGLTEGANEGRAGGTLGADGWSDTVDGLAGPLPVTNTDGTGNPNYLDIDADDDGIVDNVEAQSTAGYLAPLGTDADADGIDDRYDNSTTTFGGNGTADLTAVNTDGADGADYVDGDSDNDGYPDRFEGHDTNGDNLPDAGSNARDGIPGGTTDADGDGLLDGWDNDTALPTATNATTPATYPNIDTPGTTERDWREAANTDRTDLANGTDVDDDNDGITDLIEQGGVNPLADGDGDGILNYQDGVPGSGLPAFSDANGDGINDAYDTDRDGIMNHLDLDSDGDGIADLVEAGGVDTNGDGVVDVTTDTDGDGLANAYDTNNGGVVIPNLDTDGDGIPNARDLDSDGDGIPDVLEGGGADTNNDGLLDNTTDADGDGFSSLVDGDADGNGTAENTAGALIITGTDGNSDGRPDTYPRGNTDRTGLPNPYDLDADGDGILDVREGGLTDSDGNGIVDGTTGSDGWSDAVDAIAGALSLPNTDGRGGANYLDIDADDDGITDNIEAHPTATYQLPSGVDSDGDGIDNNYDNNDALFAGGSGNGLVPNNHDGADLPDYIDTDSDNDGSTDLKEGNGSTTYTLTNTADADGDGLVDQFDIFNLNTQTSSLQSNITSAGMGDAGVDAGPSPSGTSTLAPRNSTTGDRDWRNFFVIIPVRFLSLAALREEGGSVTLEWKVDNEADVAYYEVERSLDGRRFETAGRVAFTTSVASVNHYRYIDAGAPSGVLYYRVRQVDTDGDTQYSTVARVEGTAHRVRLYPNPASTFLHLQLEHGVQETVELQLMDGAGRVTWTKNFTLRKGMNILPVEGLQGLPRGRYVLRLTGRQGVQSWPLVLQ